MYSFGAILFITGLVLMVVCPLPVAILGGVMLFVGLGFGYAGSRF